MVEFNSASVKLIYVIFNGSFFFQLFRLESDGRLPQTFRLSMRRLTAENKWTNRESRQCPFPTHVFNRFNVLGKRL